MKHFKGSEIDLFLLTSFGYICYCCLREKTTIGGINMKCSFCNSVDTEVKMHHQVFKIKNQEILVDSSRRFCKNCHQLVYDEILDQEASLKVIEEYNKKFGIMGEEIVSLRHNLGLSHEIFAKVIERAKKPLISYEKTVCP